MKKALYRKYRPLKLEDVVGQQHITELLDQSIKQNKISHAYLFIGPRGTGKTSVARIFAHAINNFAYKTEDEHLDIIEIDAASNTGVDNIRELREKAVIAPTSGKYKIYIIDEVHMLSKSAFNALLKTLEEPPEHVVFIMATTDAYKIPVTITSRAQVYTFKLADHDTMLEHLQKIAKQEKISIDKEALDVIATRGGGSFRDSLSLLDQISNLSDQKITAEMVIDSLGLPQDKIITQILEAYTTKDNEAIIATLSDTFNSGAKTEILIEELINSIIKKPQPALLPLLEKLANLKSPFTNAKLLVSLLEIPKVQTTIITNSVTETVKTTKKTASDSFDWLSFLEKVRVESSAISKILEKFAYNFERNTLYLTPSNTSTQKIVSKPHNQEILQKAAPNISVVIKNVDSSKKDPIISQISAIMGEVQEVKYGNNSPF